MSLPTATRFIVIALAAVSIGFITASAQAEHEMRDENIETIKAAFDEWAKGTGGPYALLAENVSWTITGNSMASKNYPSREAFMSEVIRPFNARMATPLRPTINDIYVDGDTVIVYFDAKGTATDGIEYRNTYAWFLRMKSGQIVEAVAFFDSIFFDDLWTRVVPTK